MRIMVLIVVACLSGCATNGPSPAKEHALNSHAPRIADNIETVAPAEDEYCLKSESFMVEMCYARGEARIDPESGRIIGYEMKLSRINTNAR